MSDCRARNVVALVAHRHLHHFSKKSAKTQQKRGLLENVFIVLSATHVTRRLVACRGGLIRTHVEIFDTLNMFYFYNHQIYYFFTCEWLRINSEKQKQTRLLKRYHISLKALFHHPVKAQSEQNPLLVVGSSV